MLFRLLRVVGYILEVSVAIDNLPADTGFSLYTGAASVAGVGTSQFVQQRGHDVELLHDALADKVGVAAGIEYNHRNVVPSVIVVVFAMEPLPWVVGGDDEESVAVPRRTASSIKEFA